MAINKKTFTAKVLELDMAARKKIIDLRDTIHDRSAELEGNESHLVIPSFTPGATANMPIADVNMANGGSNTQIELALDIDEGYPIVIADSEQVETNVALMNTYAALAQIAHRTARNLHITTAIATAAAAAQRKAFADTVNDVISWEDFLLAAALLDEAQAPADGRHAAIPSFMHGDLFKIEHFISRDKMGQAGETIPSNVIGQVHGFKIINMPSSEMPVLDGSTGAPDDTGKACVLFWQDYAVAYGAHIFELVGPELKAGQAAEWYNLHHKYGLKAQNSTYAVSFRETN